MNPIQEKIAQLKLSLGHPETWSPRMAVAVIFFGSFIAAVLFTSLVLAGIIEIQPQAIKGFFKALVGKN